MVLASGGMLTVPIDASDVPVDGPAWRREADLPADHQTAVPLVREHGTYRIKGKIMEIYDAMATVKRSGADYQTPLTSPAGQGLRHPAR